ncbi:MAG: hypothetical protein FJW39_08650 [Acidobacteria bacterium]|nr:hypothetical protein [Acidobacteriota bacterium]
MPTRILASMTVAAAFALAQSPLPPCPDGPLLSVLPMDRDSFLSFRPLGWISPLQHVFPAKHSCFSLSRPGEPNRMLPVRFPANARLTRVSLTEYLDGSGVAYKRGYTLYFQTCREVSAYFTHLSEVPAAIAALVRRDRCTSYVTNGTPVNLCQSDVAFDVSAGDPAGVSGDAAIVDFGMTDTRIAPLGFIRPDHYMSEMLYYVSPVPYFEPEPRADLTAKLASYDGTTPRTAEPVTGAYLQDLAGTAQGNWFTPGVNLSIPFQQPDPFLALVHDYIDPSEPIISTGTSIPGLRPGVYRVRPATTGNRNRDFSAITAGAGVFCYDDFGPPMIRQTTAGGIPVGVPEGVLLIEMTSEESLRIELAGGRGATCASIGEWTLSGRAVTFER